MSFSKDFLWGTATAAYQIEGASDKDGKGPSVWDAFSKQVGKIRNCDIGDIACNHYELYEEDLELMKNLGFSSYRFSVSWPRILSEGTGKINEKGLEFYDRLIESMLKKGIEPFLSVFHWDYPYELYKKGGWLNPESSDWFAEYAGILSERFSDRVKYWVTMNEPQCFLGLGHYTGSHAPGLKLSDAEYLSALKNTQLAHGKAVMAIRENAKSQIQVGIAPTGRVGIPQNETKENIKAAYDWMFAVDQQDFFTVSMYLDPIILGKYPDDMKKEYGSSFISPTAEEFAIMKQPLDFLGFNIYHGPEIQEDGSVCIYSSEIPRTATNWPITPKALYWGPKFLCDRYKLSFIITENGMANLDMVNEQGMVEDPQRNLFLQSYLKEYEKLVDEGYPIKGYYCWSFCDNFEWAEGFAKRFGLVYVDYKTQKRIPKSSAYWFSDYIKQNKGE